MKTTIKLDGEEVTIDVRTIPDTDKVLGVHRTVVKGETESSDWTISHIPTGLALLQRISTRSKAITIGAYIFHSVKAKGHADIFASDYVEAIISCDDIKEIMRNMRSLPNR